ncbi:hypothetical protein [Autumnicola psychrophila]|uniref:Uncharacterized protein n=1 Tax=Autumnicola psychrophila TaxID=3075592 RepID=A0ABU3DWF8_9FLAO|nr:hypothetical protein [Zunongwangia sp. F225]MDT0687402.1 hypothetical protein [Zunongwangia sp. F225]
MTIPSNPITKTRGIGSIKESQMLIGGSDEDYLWQWTGEQLTDHLDLLKSIGGNYFRNTMSDRDEGNIYAPKEIENYILIELRNQRTNV